MEYKVDTQHLKENGGQKICILALDEAGRVSCVFRNHNHIASYVLINENLNIRQDKIMHGEHPFDLCRGAGDTFWFFKGLWEDYWSSLQ